MSIHKTFREIEIEILVHFDYQPEEKEVIWPIDEAYPGCPESVTINSIYVNQAEITSLFSAEMMSGIEDEILESMKPEPEE